MWSSHIGKECNSSQVYCQAKGWFQKSQEFSDDLKKSFWSGKMEGEKMDSHGKVLKMFSRLKILNSPFSKETFGAFLPFSFFRLLFLSIFPYARLFIEDELGEFWNIWGENNFFKLSFKWDGSGYTKIYEIGGGVENLSAVDAYPKMDLCTPINFFGVASSNISRRKNHFEKFKSSRRTRPLTKLNENKSFYVEYIWLW
jgi:hypothetical protein